MVRVLAVADEVAPVLYGPAVRDHRADIVLAAGDLPWDYLEFLSSALDVPVVFVPGNHDPAIPPVRQSRLGYFLEAGRIQDAPRPHGAVNADDQIVTAAGLRIAGLGGCVQYRNGPHQYTQRQFERRARKLVRRAQREGMPVDVVLTHAPPLELGDGTDRAHLGIAALPQLLSDLAPPWHLHGHIHPYGRPTPDRMLGDTTIRNVIPWMLFDIEPAAQSRRIRDGA